MTDEEAADLVLRLCDLLDPVIPDPLVTVIREGDGVRVHIGENFDPRDFGLTADDLDAVADRLYDAGDRRLEPVSDVSIKFGPVRSHLRGLADAIREDGS